MIDNNCEHKIILPEVVDQTLGVACLECNTLLAHCWGDEHIPESLWNRSCETQMMPGNDFIKCEESRDNFCALCRDEIKT